ncbi:MAG: hypothetical protein WCK89_23100 [bacterium]
MNTSTIRNMMIYQPADGNGRWSLHLAGTSPADCAAGVGILASGPSDWDDELGEWSRPDGDDFMAAYRQRRRLEQTNMNTSDTDNVCSRKWPCSGDWFGAYTIAIPHQRPPVQWMGIDHGDEDTHDLHSYITIESGAAELALLGEIRARAPGHHEHQDAAIAALISTIRARREEQ